MITALLAPAAAFAAGGKVTQEQAQFIALKAEPGIIQETDTKTLTGGIVYEFEIRIEDGAIMEVEVDGNTGAILEHKLDTPAPDASVPAGGITQEDAEARALQHALSLSGDKGRGKIKETKFSRYGKFDAYEIDVKAGFYEYVVFVDIKSGKILSAEKDN